MPPTMHSHSSTCYPRDLIGYGGHSPDPQWPEAARIAVQIVLNYEEGGERNVLHGDGESEAFLSEIIRAEPWPEVRHMNMESIYEYGSRAGFWRLLRILQAREVPVTVFGVATALARNLEAVNAMREAKWEIACHGLKWIDYRNFSKADEWDHIQQAIALHTQVTGTRPTGWYTGRTSENTLELVAAAGGFEYVADSYADDLPYWCSTGSGPMLIVPYTLDANDMHFAETRGFNSGTPFFDYMRDSFDVLYQEGVAGNPKMMSIGLHCRLVGRPGRAAALTRFLDYAGGHDKVWFARRVDIARHWRGTWPAEGSN